MTILLPVLAVAFGTFCVWLTVRIVNRRERWAKWTMVLILVGVPLMYPLSLGPAKWLYFHGMMPAWLENPIEEFYGPLRPVLKRLPDSVRLPYLRYLDLWGN